MQRSLTTLLTLLAANAVAADCEFERKFDETLDLDGVTTLSIVAAAGDLEIRGAPGIASARVQATLCASTQELADQSEVILEPGLVGVKLPDWNAGIFSGHQYAYADLVLDVPEHLPLDVKDSSGDIEIENVATTRLRDSSGNIGVTRLTGTLTIEDSSGQIDIRGVEGDVDIVSDSSGDIDGRDITGSVRVGRDSSGDIRFQDVGGDVLVERDSSGGIRVATVGGDFRVLNDGSGGVSHRDVSGAIDIPTDD